jgi:hypothetical protein
MNKRGIELENVKSKKVKSLGFGVRVQIVLWAEPGGASGLLACQSVRCGAVQSVRATTEFLAPQLAKLSASIPGCACTRTLPVPRQFFQATVLLLQTPLLYRKCFFVRCDPRSSPTQHKKLSGSRSRPRPRFSGD